MKVVIISGTHTGAGSTTVSLCLMNMFRKQGLRVQSFKFGPDFSENDLFESATGRMSVNLVPWSVPRDCLLSCLCRYGTECDIAVIDGSGGLFDRRPESDGWTTAELARFLMVPVILVVDANSMAQSCAALVKGFESFDRKVRVAGVVLNRVNDSDHASMLDKALCKDGVKAECLGWMISGEGLLSQAGICERRGETDRGYFEHLSVLGEELRTRKVIEISTLAKVPRPSSSLELESNHNNNNKRSTTSNCKTRIAVAKDTAFSFYYHENFMMLESSGAELIFFSPLEDHRLPDGISAVYLGGGRPEFHVAKLSRNTPLIASIRAFAAAGGIIYAEGGGFSYLTKSIENEHEFSLYPLVGLFPFRTVMLDDSPSLRNVSVSVEMLDNCPVFPSGTRAKGHICHRSQIRQENVMSLWEEQDGSEESLLDYEFSRVYRLYREESGYGSANEGYCKEGVLGSYVHLQFASDRRLAPAFIKRCKEVNLSKVQEAVKQALMNVNIQIVKNAGTPRLTTPRTSAIHPELEFGKPPPPPSSISIQSTKSEIDEKKQPELFLNKNSISQYSSQGALLSGFQSKKLTVPVYSCMESKGAQFTNSRPWKEEYLMEKGSTSKSKISLMEDSLHLECAKEESEDAKSQFTAAKIVGLSTTGVEMVCALGLHQSLIGITNLCKFPNEIQKGRRVVATTKFEASNLDDSRLELRLKDFWCRQESAFVLDEDYMRNEAPHLVIVEEGGDPGRKTVEQIFQTKTTVFTGLSPTKILSHKCLHLSEILQFMLEIAQAAGVEDSASSVVDKLRSRIARIGCLIAPDFPVERVLVLTCLNPLMIGGFWIPEMVALAGGESLGAKAGHPHQRVTWEELKNLEPEVLILAAASWEETKHELKELASLPGWWAMPAMKTGQLYVCDPSLFTMAGPRLIDGIELLARILHPSSAGQYGKQGMAWSCTLRAGKRCRPCHLYRQFCTLL
eukprot:g4404.t1